MRLIRFIQKINWKIYLMELVIVILGITIAYQLNIVYEDRVNHKLELSALENLKKENEINLEEFESLELYRERITDRTVKLGKLLKNPPLVKDSVENYLFSMVQTSTPDLQHEASNFYLNSNYSNRYLVVKNEVLTLKTFLQEFTEMSNGYKEKKSDVFMHYLRDAVDFDQKVVVNLNKIASLEFKNIIWNQGSDEFELNRLYNQAFDQLKMVQFKVDSILNQAQ